MRCVACAYELGTAWKVRTGSVHLNECAKCGSWTSLPRPTPQDQAALHDAPEYHEHPYFEERRENVTRTDLRCETIFQRIAAGIDLKELAGAPMLDVGCDTGAFVRAAARRYGVRPFGLDVARLAVDEARRSGVEAYCSPLEIAPAHLRDFQVITAIDLIEHLVDAGQFLEHASVRLAPGGVIYLETPNIKSMVYRFGRWLSKVGKPRATIERLFPPHHIQYFTAEGFKVLAGRAGLEVVSISCRRLPFQDVAVSKFVGVGISGLQFLDWMFRSQILLCAVLRRGQ